MSTTIDERVVEMRFDNQHFEKNVSTSMSTLDKLKQKLNLTGASKGLENVDAAAKKVNMSGLGTAVDTISSKFSAMDVIGVTALANITNSAVNAGKRIVSALTIDPVKTGFSEYETQINAVQTILANTESKGSTIDDVNEALEQLNKYADKTIYNFTEMTRNIGTFTAAGVDLDTSVNAIQGIANLAAVSGSTSQQASTAMYQLSQALASGTVKLMDWNSVVNAGMGGEVFQNALKETARVHGVAIDSMIESEGSFRETLKDGWLTADILTETLQKFTLTTEGLTEEQIEANREMLRAKGYTEDQINEIFKLGNTATNAATKVKTFTQLWDVMKESAQSGWAQTWKILIGDFEEAKALLTPLADLFTGFINKMSDWRNSILEKAMSSPFASIIEKINNVTKATEVVTKVTKDYAAVVDEIISGKWGNGQERWDKLTEAGYDWAHAQNLVNEKLGNSFRRVTDYKEAQEEVNKTQAVTIEQLSEMSNKQLRQLGFTWEEILAFRELQKTCEKTGVSMKDALANPDLLSGRTLLINSFKNLGKVIGDTFRVIARGWKEIFPPKTIEERAEQLYNMIAALHKFTVGIKDIFVENNKLTETGENLLRTFKGLFAVIDIITTITGGAFKIAFEIVREVLSYFNMDILDVTASIGDILVGFRDWIDRVLDVGKVVKAVIPAIQNGIKVVKGWVESFLQLPKVQKFIESISSTFEEFKSIIGNIDFSDWSSIKTGFVTIFESIYNKLSNINFKEIGTNIIANIRNSLSSFDAEKIASDFIAGFDNGLLNKVSDIVKTIFDIGKQVIQSLMGVLDEHSPSKEAETIGENFMQGFINGVENFASNGLESVKEFGRGLIEWFNSIEWGSVFAAGFSLVLLSFIKKIGDAFSGFASLAGGIGSLLEDTGDGVKLVLKKVAKVVNSFAKVLNSAALFVSAKAILELAKALAILVASVVVLSFIPAKNLWNAVGAITALAAVLGGLIFLATNMAKYSGSIKESVGNFAKVGTMMAGVGIALLMLAATVKILGSMDPNESNQGFLGLTAIVVGLLGIMAVIGILMKGKVAKNAEKVGNMLIKLAGALVILTLVAKILSGMTWGELGKAGAGLAGLVTVIALLMTIALIPAKNVSKVGKTLRSISVALLILTVIGKIIAGMSWAEMGKAAAGLAGLVAVIALLMTIALIPAKNVDQIGKTLLGISGAMLLLTLTAKILAGMEWADMGKAAVGLAGLVAIIGGLIAVVNIAKGDAPKIALTLLALSLAVAILSGVALVLSIMPLEGLAKGIVAVGMLSAFVSLMAVAARGASECKGTIIAMSIAIAAMAAAVIALSLIKDTSKLWNATAAMSVLIGMFALAMKAGSNIQKAVGTLLVMTLAIGIMGGLVYLLSRQPVESVLGSAAALSILLLSMSAALMILSNVGRMGVSALAGVILLTAMAIPLLAFVGVLAVMQNVQNATNNVKTLTILATALTLLMIPLTLIGAVWPLAAAGIIALTAMAIPLLAFVGVLALMNKIQNATDNVDLILSLITSMTNVLAKLAIVGPLALIGVSAMAALTLVVTAIGLLATGLGALVQKFPEIETFLDTGVALLEKLSYSIGYIVGSLVSGLGVGLTSGLPAIGANLSAFMMTAMPFIMGMKLVDSTTLAGAGYLAGAIVALTVADFINGIASFVSFGSSFSDLGTELSKFAVNALPFIMIARTVNEGMLGGVKALAETILILTAANVLEGLTSWFTGGSSLTSFGEQLPILATHINDFVTNLGAFDETKVATVQCAVDAIKAMADAAESLPKEGGWVQKLLGEQSLASFGGQLPTLATNLNSFVTNLGTFTEEQVTTVGCAADAVKALADAANDIPNEGGWAAKILGDNSLATFGDQLPTLGTNLAAFVTNLGTFTDEQVSTVNCAGNAIKSLAQASNSIDGQAEWAKKIFGDNGLSAFGDEMASLGTSLSDFVTNLGTFTEAQVATVKSAVSAIKALTGLADTDLKGAQKNLPDFADALPELASGISSFTTDMPTADSVNSAASNIRTLIKVIGEIANANSGVLSTFAENLKKVGEAAIKKFVSAFTSDSAKTDLKSAAEKLGDKVVEGIEAKEDKVEDAGEDLADKAIDGLDGLYDDAKTAGKDLGSGLVAGIEAKEDAAYEAGYALGQAAVQGEKDGQASNSPSKLTMLAGRWLGEGLVIGIEKMGKSVYSAGSDLGKSATKSISSAISRITDVIDSDMDIQPTITPVLDLSNVRSGAGTIAGLFDMNPSMGVLANVGAISSTMNRIQNGSSNDDVVSAINKLRKDLGGVRGDTYSINGITYDDGSNIADAVKTLTRAVKVGRRV